MAKNQPIRDRIDHALDERPIRSLVVIVALVLLLSAAIAFPIGMWAAQRNSEKAERCESIGAEPVESGGRIGFCALPDGSLVRIPE